MARRTSRRRAAALRAALEAKAQRDAQRLEREREIEAALADFYEANGTAREIQEQARQRAEKVMNEGEEKAQQAITGAAAAVRRLRDLGQTNAEIAELCQIPPGLARAMAKAADFEPSSAVEHSAGTAPGHLPRQRTAPATDTDTRPDTGIRAPGAGQGPSGISRADQLGGDPPG